jgi:hypothetical protein
MIHDHTLMIHYEKYDQHICALQHTQNEPGLFKLVITCDATWIFTHDLETRRQCIGKDQTLKEQKGHESFIVQGHAVCLL